MYQQKNDLPAPASWFVISLTYNNEKDSLHRSKGDDYSFVHYVGDKRLGIKSINRTIIFFQGEEVIKTPENIVSGYFSKVKALDIRLFVLPKTEYGFN